MEKCKFSQAEIDRVAAKHACATGAEHCGRAAVYEALRLQRERIVAELRIAADDKGMIGTARDPQDALHDFADMLERNS